MQVSNLFESLENNEKEEIFLRMYTYMRNFSNASIDRLCDLCSLMGFVTAEEHVAGLKEKRSEIKSMYEVKNQIWCCLS